MVNDPRVKNLVLLAQGFVAFAVPYLMLTESFIVIHSLTTDRPYRLRLVLLWALLKLITLRSLSIWIILGMMSGLKWMNKGSGKAIRFIAIVLLLVLWLYGLMVTYTPWLDWGLN